ncbi:MAG: glycosyltransferase [Desulfomonilaceae bacterium]
MIERCYGILPKWLTSRVISALNYPVLRISGLFDKSYYLATGPDVANPIADPIIHYLRKGAAEGRDPNPWFDTIYYISTHPSTISAGINPLFHFIVFGARHGSRPHPLFDIPYYITENPDVAKSGMNPLAHFIRYGVQQGRLPDPLFKETGAESVYKELVDASLQQEISPPPSKVSAAHLRNRLLTRRMLKLYDITPEQIRWMSKTGESFSNKPVFTLVIYGKGPGDEFSESLKSVVNQAYPYWSVVILIDDESGRVQVEREDQVRALMDKGNLSLVSGKETIGSTKWIIGDFVAFMRSGDRLTLNALFKLAQEINVKPDCDLIYCDEYRENSEEFFFKPGWSPELLFSGNYIGDFFAVRSALFHELGGLRTATSEAGIYDLLLRLSGHASRVDHIAMPLLHRTNSIHQNNPIRLKRKINDQARVSIIIPTAYSNPNRNLFPCLRTVVEKTSYSNCEIIIVDNSRGKLNIRTINKIVPISKALKVVKCDGPFNYSGVMNKGAAEAEGDYLLLLNDDVEIVTPDWIEVMLEYAQMDEIGVVGAKLLYPDGRIQHAGCFITDNGRYTRHAFQYMCETDESSLGLTSVVRNCSHVTFACAMVRKQLFIQLGQLDEQLDVEYNDADFCLRAIKAGYRVVYTPFATLIHKDSQTRSLMKMVKISSNINLFHDRWLSEIEYGDRYFNPNLSLETSDYSISDRPVLIEPLDHKEKERYLGAAPGISPSLNHPGRAKSLEPLLIVIDSTSSDAMRTWPREHFARLSDLLSTKLPASVIVNSGTEDFRANIGELDLFIGNLSENSALAASMGIPTLIIWPGCASPQESGFIGERAIRVRMAVPCSPCYKTNSKECPYDVKCMKMLWPYQVLEATRQALVLFGAG